jgi:zinc transport system ATP-binding protein
MSLLECKDVSFSYEGNTVLSDVNFKVEAGDYLCIVGENGAGKSTLLKGLLKLKAPSEGTILTDGALKSGRIGYLPQKTAVQSDFPASVFEIVLSGRLNSRGHHPFYTREDKKQASDKMTLLGIESLKNKCYRNLSGGQQQRVLLARALCATQTLLLLDEPVSGLDPVITAEFYRIISMLNKECGITVVMVSHDVAGAVKQSGHILHLSNRQLFFGTTADYLKSEAGIHFMGGRCDD